MAQVSSPSALPKLVRRFIFALALAVTAASTALFAQQIISGRNVNMVSGTKWPDGDPYLQRQNEPSIAASTRNPLHLLAGANDYRTVDIPFVDNSAETGDAWLGIFKSFDGGQRWKTTLLPGYPQDASPEGIASPLKGYTAGADPVVRAGTSGLLYYTGLVFDRTADGNGRSAIFAAHFIDNNNLEAGDPIKYLGTKTVATSPGGANAAFLDKPWLAVDIPRGTAACQISTPGVATQTVPAGAVYVTYTAFTKDVVGDRADIYLTVSNDCGVSWTPAARVNSGADRLNQGATMAIDPRNGNVFIAWRRFAVPTDTTTTNGLMVAQYNPTARTMQPAGLVRKLPDQKFGNIVDKIAEKRKAKTTDTTSVPTEQGTDNFDQATTDISSDISFRTNAYPTLTIDATGRLYMAWAERGFGTARPSTVDGDARIVMSVSPDGTAWSTPIAVADESAGHQFMPTLTTGGGRLVLVYYDLRDDVSRLFSPYADDKSAITARNSRRTLDLRASLGTLGALPVFQPSARVSEYLMRQTVSSDGTVTEQQMQYNAPNLPMFKLGTAPFIGDYIDITNAPTFVPIANGGWKYNSGGQVVFHAVWTDNRDVRQPVDGPDAGTNPWDDYSPPTERAGMLSPSRIDPTKTLPVCNPANTGSRNQNIYTARLTTGLIVGSPGNTKPLSLALQRAFSVFAQNTTYVTKRFRMTIANQPIGGRASFDQFSAAPVTTIDVVTPARSLAARTVYATSSNPDASIAVNVQEVDSSGTVNTNGLSDVILLNPDISNPDISNPDISNPDISNAEVYNPDISNPDISNPDISNPDISNPDISNPDISNPDISNPDISNPDISNVVVANPDISNPGISNPDISNPDISNPDISNPDISNTALTDVTWTITNEGNTSASYNVNLFLAQASDKICLKGESPTAGDGCLLTQLILHKVYATPTATACQIQVTTQNVLIASIPTPTFVTPGTAASTPNAETATNATMWLAPGEKAKITLRIADPNPADNATFKGKKIDPVFFPTESGQGGLLTPFVTQQAVNTTDISIPSPGGTPTVTRYPASVFFVQQPINSAPGVAIAPAVSVQVRDQLGALLPNTPVSITLAGPAAVLSGGGPVSTDGNGIATFPSLAIGAAGVGYQLQASVGTTGTSISNTSVLFNIVAPPAPSALLSFVQQPWYAEPGMPITPAVVVQVRDQSGAAVAGVPVSITLEPIIPSPGGVLLSGGGTVSTDDVGEATFAALSINLAGSGYRLRASLVSTTAGISVVSDPFAVVNVFAIGGTGGNPFAPIDCSASGAVTALTGKYTIAYAPLGALGDTNVWCSNAPAAPAGTVLAADDNPAGRWVDYGTALTCPTGKVIQSVQAHVPPDNEMVTHVTITCTLPNGTAPESRGPSDTSFEPVGLPLTAACPAGQVVVGIGGRSGLFIDQLQLRCGVR